jgi:hypothetical protein
MTLHDLTVPAFAHSLRAMSAILDKAESHCAARRIDQGVLLASRLYPDMLPLARQIQIAADHARRCAARLAQVEAPAAPDTETSFAELRDRLASTIAYVGALDPAAFAGAETRTIQLKAGARELTFSGLDYVRHFALPNFWFHLGTAYGILRHNGVEIGKVDFLGG